jgi:hypothetical protein
MRPHWRPGAAWRSRYAFAREHFKDRARRRAGARILLTGDVDTADGVPASWLELVEL